MSFPPLLPLFFLRSICSNHPCILTPISKCVTTLNLRTLSDLFIHSKGQWHRLILLPHSL